MNSNNAKKDPSTREFLTSIAMNLAFLCASVLAFILMRRKVKRIYQPKSSFHLITEEKMPDPLPSGPWQWLPALLKKSDNFIIQQAGLDGYGFLRYLYVMSLYAFFSILWMFPLLLPLNAVGGESDDGSTTNGLNKFSISHVQRTSKRYYGHVLASWVFFGGFLFVVYRELIFYTALRQAILSSPRYAKKLSSRTVLFQSVPQQYLSETEFSKLFEGVKRVWITRASSELASLVAKRDALAYKLEAAETAYLRKAFKRAMKAKKRGHTVTGDITDYLTDKERPRHRKVFLVGRKVDTIDHTKEKLEELQEKVLNMQKLHMEAEAYSSVFVEFESQYHAHLAHSCIAYHAPLKMCPSYLGIEPKDIVWFNTRISWWERKVGTLVSGCIITAMILFWAFITAGIATISNLKTLTEKVKWLSFLNDIISKKAMGLISGYLAPLILVLVMMIPVNVIRKLSIIAGAPTVQHSEFYTQKGYFAFQVVQVFLVTTIASSIIIVLPSVIGSPKKILDTLSEDLPKSSNFFISFMVLQGFSVSSSSLIQLVGLVLYYLMGAINDKTARQKWVRFVELEKPEWGRLFPVNSLLVVLMLSYSIISPIILLFASVAFFLLYVVHLYNLTYVYQEAADTRGMFYPRALFQSITGIYLGEICLLGLLATGQKWDLLSKGKIGKLFSTGQGWGPIILQFIGVVATYVIHRQLKTSFSGLLEAVPLDVMKPLDGKTETPSYKPRTKASKEEEIQELPHFPIKKYQPRNSGINSDQKTISVLSDKTYELYGTTYMKNENALNMIPVLADVDTNPVPYAPFWKRFIQPGTFCSYKAVKSKLPDIYNLPDPSENLDDADNEYAYCYPAVSAKCPHIWIPRDPFGFSTAEIKKLKDVVNITDEGAILNEKGKVVWTSKPPDFSLSITSAHSPFSDETRAEE